MRILHVISSLGAGGAETLARDLAVEQSAAGDTSGIAYLSNLADIGRNPAFAGPFAAELQRHGISHYLVGHRRNPVAGARRLRAIVRDFRPDVIHAHVASGTLLTGLAMTGTPIVYTHHASFYPFSPRWMIGLNRIVSAFVGVCEASGQLLRPHARRPVRVIHNGRRSASIPGVTRRFPQRPLRFLSVGSLVVEKDYPTLVAAAALAAAEGSTATFGVAGDGPERARLEAAIRNGGLGDRIKLLGVRDDVEALLREHDALVSTSRTEALPIAMIEALQAALPIVATDVGGVRDLVEDGVNGLLAPSGDPVAVADRLRRLSADPGVYEAMSAAALARVAEYSIEACRDRYAALYREVVRPSSAR